MIFAGIGSRDTSSDPDIELLIIAILKLLKPSTLRSGGANGIDTFFERNHVGPKEIYLPYKGFNSNLSPLYKITDDAKILARQFHPLKEKLAYPNINFIARNGYQVLGYDLKTPVDFVICWTLEPKYGGTSQALKIAAHHNIPIFNLAFEEDIISLSKYLKAA